MDRLRISQRLYLSIAAFLLLIGILAYYFVDSVQANVEFALQEKRGDSYQRPLMGILSRLAEYEMIGASARGNRQALLAQKAGEIDKEFAALRQADAQLGAALQFTPEGLASRKREHLALRKVEDRWKALAQAPAGAAFLGQVQGVIADIRGMVAHMGDTSNLILDPDLDSYYLMDATLLVLPQTLDRLGAIGATVHGMLAKGQLEQADKVELQRLASLLKEADLDRAFADYDTAFNEDPNFYGVSPSLKPSLEPKREAYRQANEALIAAMHALAVSGGWMGDEEWSRLSMQAAGSAMALWTASVNELDILIDRRVEAYNQHIAQVLAMVAAGLLAAIGFFYVVIRSIRVPLSQVQHAMTEIAKDKLEQAVPHIGLRDEIGAMAKALQQFKESAMERKWLEEEQKKTELAAQEEKKQMMRKLAGDFQSGVQDVIATVAAAAGELCRTAEYMQSTIAKVSNQSGTVAAASSQASTNVENVSAAVEQMSASVKDIAHQVAKSSTLVNETVAKTQQADQTTKLLSGAVSEISGVLQLIQDIAGQINLLALNATIESARAGDAGKGFAVVASEVKDLAAQTTKATEQIARQVENVQQASQEVVAVLKNINQAIGHVNQYSSGIASAVEEQSAATRDISSNMQHATLGVQDISSNIAHITHGAGDADLAAREVLNAAQTLSEQADQLKRQVKLFLDGIAA